MKKIRLQLLLALLLPFVGQLMMAGEVSEQEALQKAQQFLQGRTFGQKNLRRTATTNTFAQGAFYVFNADGDNGFVIVSADDRTTAILGYADEGRLDLSNLPANAAFWLQDYARQIKSLGTTINLTAPHRAPGTTVVAPLVTCKWDQSKPFNDLCPTDKNGKCYTGCAATAMAEILFYNKWPLTAGPYDTYQSKGVYSTINMPAVPAVTFNYEKMRDTYVIKDEAPQYTEEEGEAVAQLMQYCGYALKMQYSSRESSAPIHAKELYSLGYTTACEASRYGFTTEEWEKLVYDEVVARRAVLYYGANEEAAHEFIVDGFDGNGLFHVNWGWGGASDGYFTLSLLNPESKGMGTGPADNGFPMAQSIIFGLKKPEAGDVAVGSIVYTHVQVTDGAEKTYTRTAVSENFKDVKCTTNFSYSGVNPPVIEVITNVYHNGEYKETLNDPYTVKLEEDETPNLDYELTFGKDYADGTYEIAFSYRFKGTEQWLVPKSDSKSKRLFAVISGNQLTISDSPNTVTVNSVTIEGDNVVNRPMSVIVNWTRPVDNELNENAFFVWYEGDEKDKRLVGGMSSFIARGETQQNLVIAFKVKTPGDYKFYLTSDSEGKYKIADISGTYTFRDIKQQDLSIDWTEENRKGEYPEYTIDALEFHPMMIFKNNSTTNTYDDYFITTLTPVDASGQPTGERMEVRKKITLAPGAIIDKAHAVQVDFTGLTNGQRYQFCAYHYSNEPNGYYYKWISQEFITVNNATGIQAVEAKDQADAPVYNMMGQRVDKNTRGLVIYKGKKYLNK